MMCVTVSHKMIIDNVYLSELELDEALKMNYDQSRKSYPICWELMEKIDNCFQPNIYTGQKHAKCSKVEFLTYLQDLECEIKQVKSKISKTHFEKVLLYYLSLVNFKAENIIWLDKKEDIYFIDIDWVNGTAVHVQTKNEKEFVFTCELSEKYQSDHVDILKFNEINNYDSHESFLKTIRPILSKIKEGYLGDDKNGDAEFTDDAHTYMHLVRCMIMGDDAVDAFCLGDSSGLGGSYGEESWLQEMPVMMA